MFISFMLFIFMLTSVVIMLFLIFFEMIQYIIIPIVIFLLSFLLLRMWFYHRCRKFIDFNRTIIQINKFIKINDKNEGIIVFNFSKGEYICENNNEFIRFKLNGFLLKKSFVRAFVIRQIRYKIVSNKLKCSKLFSLKLKGNYRYDTLTLIIDDHKYLIFSKGYSRNTIFSSEISKAKYGAMYLSARTLQHCNVVEELNESIYLEKFKFYKKYNL